MNAKTNRWKFEEYYIYTVLKYLPKDNYELQNKQIVTLH